ncbi:LysR family transcriptional regulator [Pseudooceanicola sp. CBS1P-1]|uniref:LysR family transcriptional regulator n=1 Tax=Pseudooceanicola albus TaxID=2692189 RepID=A0A6L7G2Q7_9RHOB|nr:MULTISPECIES: LysR family transcriptional regulator [Pseudooceanicola]MBT9384694.1 LysR family transcriptional regulator [Pseudooceanicola endophyticus]MXN18395.1 LysR family transcriptional regulator [Pseudooceanicola albus]
MRNLDMTSLRSFVAVADHGGVTKAAGILNFTQSAVSMQLKRLEETLGIELLDRSSRRIALTSAGEQLLGYARRIIEMNDEALTRLTSKNYEGEIVLGVPHDIVYPVVPGVLKRFSTEFPRMKVQLVSGYTRSLKEQFERGEVDIILTTEIEAGPRATVLDERPLAWIGGHGGTAWRQRPLRFASGRNCVFRPHAIRMMDQAGLDWENAVDTGSDRTVEATVSADLAISVMIEGSEPPMLSVIEHGGDLPELGTQLICMYVQERGAGEVGRRMAELLRLGYAVAETTPAPGARREAAMSSAEAPSASLRRHSWQQELARARRSGQARG